MLESLVAAGIGLAGSVLLGFVFAGFHSPVALALMPTAAGAGWWFRDSLRSPLEWGPVTWVLLVAIIFVAILVLIPPSYIGRAIEYAWHAGPPH